MPTELTTLPDEALATICTAHTEESCEARKILIARKALAYDEWCMEPSKCVGKGYCPRDSTCAD